MHAKDPRFSLLQRHHRGRRAFTGSIALLIAVGWLPGCGPGQSITRIVQPIARDGAAGISRPDGSATPDGGHADTAIPLDPHGDDAGVTPLPDAPAEDTISNVPSSGVDASPLDVLPLPPTDPADAQPNDVISSDTGTDAPNEGLVIHMDSADDETDLSDVGEIDWMHWGLQRPTDANRKRGVAARIRWSVEGDRVVATYGGRPVAFQWNDGTPTENASTRQGVTTGGAINIGYRLRVDGPFDKPGRLTVYAGVWNATAELRVRVRGRSSLGASNRALDATTPGRDRIMAIDFPALEDDETLMVDWVITQLHDPAGNITMQAAALAPARAVESAN